MAIRQEPQIVVDDSTNLVTLKGLQNTATLEYPTDATVTCMLVNEAGTPIVGAASIQMPYVSGTGKNSVYRGVLDSDLDLTGLAAARVVITKDGAQRTIVVRCNRRAAV